MTVRYVNSTAYPTITAAIADSIAGDTVSLLHGYSHEAASITAQNMFFDGTGQSSDIKLTLAAGVAGVTLLGRAGFDVDDNSGANVIIGNDGANIISVSGGADVVHGGGGRDCLSVDYSSAVATVTATVVGVTDGGTNSVVYDGVENVFLRTGSGNDTVTVAGGDNKVKSAGGNDTITVGDGHNNVGSGAGNDTVTAGDGGNRVGGGNGDNTITTGEGADAVHTKSGNDTVRTGGGNDLTLVTGGADSVDSGAGSDQLSVKYDAAVTGVSGGIVGGDLASGYTGGFAYGASATVQFSNTENFSVVTGSGADHILTGAGHDLLSAGAGADTLNAGDGVDRIFGGAGNDLITGGGGRDVMTGNDGADTFVFTGLGDSRATAMDRITDLHNVDVVDISGIDADTGQSGDQAFALVDHFTGHAGQAVFAYSAASDATVLSLDVNGDAVADFSLEAAGAHKNFDNFVF